MLMQSALGLQARTNYREEQQSSAAAAATATAASSSQYDYHDPMKRRKKAVGLGRVAFVGFLAAVAATLGYCAHSFLQASETSLAQRQYESVAERALTEAVEVTNQLKLSAVTMAGIFSQTHPHATAWPFVHLDGWESLVQNLLAATDGYAMSFVPLVRSEDQDAFETYAYDYFETSTNPVYPIDAAISSFGKGIYAFRSSNSSSRKSAGNTNTTANASGTTRKDNRYRSETQPFLAPVFHSSGSGRSLFFNLYSVAARAEVMDDIQACSAYRQELFRRGNNATSLDVDCHAVTTIVNSVIANGKPGAIMLEPIYPYHDPTTLVGFITSPLLWEDILENIFPERFSDVDCVIETDEYAMTYEIRNGKPRLVTGSPNELKGKPGPESSPGTGDFHCSSLSRHKRSSVLIQANRNTKSSPVYTLSIYPRQGYYEVYSTNNPRIAMAGAVCILILTSMAFFIYDFFVRQESQYGNEVLHAKRQFMRYVSHEVRTPLNSVSMGLSVLKYEMAKAANMSVSELEARHRAETQGLLNAATNHHPELGSAQNAVEWFDLTDDIQTSAQSAVNILNDLLNYDKIEQGVLKLDVGIVDIWQVLEETVEEFHLPASDKELAFAVRYVVRCGGAVVDVANSLPSPRVLNLRLIGDSIKIAQVIRNLLSNAIKFTPRGGKLDILVTVDETPSVAGRTTGHTLPLLPLPWTVSDAPITQPAGMMTMQVQDSGAGMSSDQITGLFRDGVQFNVNKLQAGQGTGLGLFISKGIVEHHNGTLTASSEGVGKGTTFTVKIPLCQVVTDDVTTSRADATIPWADGTLADTQKTLDDQISTTAPSSDEDSSHSSAACRAHSGSAAACSSTSSSKGTCKNNHDRHRSSLNILVVDDVLSNRKLLARILTNAGHTCQLAENGQVAVDMIQQAMRQESSVDDERTAPAAGPTTTRRRLPFDTILMDFEMPVMDGPTATKVIRTMLAGKEFNNSRSSINDEDDKTSTDPVFIVGITGNVLPEDVRHFLSCGADAVLPKPIHIADLERTWMEAGLCG